STRRHTRCYRDWSSDVCSSDLQAGLIPIRREERCKAWRRALSRKKLGMILMKRAVSRFLSAACILAFVAPAFAETQPPKPAIVRSEERRLGKAWTCSGRPHECR